MCGSIVRTVASNTAMKKKTKKTAPVAGTDAHEKALRAFWNLPHTSLSNYDLYGEEWEEVYPSVIKRLATPNLQKLTSFLNGLDKTDDTTAHAENLFANLCEYIESLHGAAPTPYHMENVLTQHLTDFAEALTSQSKEYLDRPVEAWTQNYFERLQLQQTKRYLALLEKDAIFRRERADILAMWPSGLGRFCNTEIPYRPRLFWVMQKDEPWVATETSSEEPVPDIFLQAARKFVRKWNLKSMNNTAAGVLQVDPITIECSLDVNSYGTHIFVPGYYKFSDILRHEDTDFRSLKRFMDHSHRQWNRKRKSQNERGDEMLRYIEGRFRDEPRTKELIFKLVDDWMKQQSLTAPSQRTIYRNIARKHFDLPHEKLHGFLAK